MKKVLAIIALALFIGGLSVPVMAAGTELASQVELQGEETKKKKKSEKSTKEATKPGDCAKECEKKCDDEKKSGSSE
jgi:hypothetical protein